MSDGTITKAVDKGKLTAFEIEGLICDITERNYEKNLSQREIYDELAYEKETLLQDIENGFYVNEADKILKKQIIKKIEGELLIYGKDLEGVNQEEETLSEIKPVIKAGGLVVGKKDRTVRKWHKKKLWGKIPYPSCEKRKVEDIYYVKDDMHSLTIRCYKVTVKQGA